MASVRRRGRFVQGGMDRGSNLRRDRTTSPDTAPEYQNCRRRPPRSRPCGSIRTPRWRRRRREGHEAQGEQRSRRRCAHSQKLLHLTLSFLLFECGGPFRLALEMGCGRTARHACMADALSNLLFVRTRLQSYACSLSQRVRVPKVVAGPPQRQVAALRGRESKTDSLGGGMRAKKFAMSQHLKYAHHAMSFAPPIARARRRKPEIRS